MVFRTIGELNTDTRKKINELTMLVDVLVSEYKTASEIIDDKMDHRQKYITQLKELNQTLTELIATHPAMYPDKITQNAISRLSQIVDTNVNRVLI